MCLSIYLSIDRYLNTYIYICILIHLLYIEIHTVLFAQRIPTVYTNVYIQSVQLCIYNSPLYQKFKKTYIHMVLLNEHSLSNQSTNRPTKHPKPGAASPTISIVFTAPSSSSWVVALLRSKSTRHWWKH